MESQRKTGSAQLAVRPEAVRPEVEWWLAVSGVETVIRIFCVCARPTRIRDAHDVCVIICGVEDAFAC